jgi:cytochrome c-type biogenesis protein CcmH/NrfG
MSTARPAISTRQQNVTTWTNSQAYVLAAFCLMLGVTLGYLFRGSASQDLPAAAPQTAPTGAPQGMGQGQITPEQQKAMVDRAAAPLLTAVQNNPNDFETLVKLGNLYFDGQQYGQAIEYYERGLAITPDNPDVLTDAGTAYWYAGSPDKALADFQKSLKVRPNHPGTLFNMGVVKWQGKGDPAGAVAAWQELLKANPDYPQRQQVEEFIAKAKQHASKG